MQFATLFRYLPVACLFGVAFLMIIRDYLDYPYSIDVDHFMYFGQRVLSGDLPWAVEFDDKLPFVQYIFVLPALLGTPFVLYAFSIITTAFSAFCIYRYYQSLPSLSEDGNERFFGWVSTALLLYLFLMLQSGFMHLNVIAANLAISSALVLLISVNRRFFLFFVLSTILACFAISIRPYFLVAVLLSPFWWSLRSQMPILRGIRFSIIWIACVGFFGLLVNFLPHLLFDQVEDFLAGINLLSENLIDSNLGNTIVNFARGLLNDSSSIFLVLIITGPVSILLLVIHRRKQEIHRQIFLDLLFFGFVAPVAILFMIFSKHFWSHYLQFFVPYLVLSSVLSFRLLSKSWRFPNHSSVLGLVAAAVVVTADLDDVARAARFVVAPPGTSEARQFVTLISERLDQVSGERPGFLVPGDMFAHWYLEEPRRGFLHAANASFVHLGWWDDIDAGDLLDVPTSSEALCNRLAKHPVDVIFLPLDDASLVCREQLALFFERQVPLSEVEAQFFEVWTRAR